MNFKSVVSMIEEALKEDVFPCAAYAIGNGERVLHKGFWGNRTLYPDSQPLEEDTLFDMASLSKLVSTTMIALKAIETGKLCLDDKLYRFFPECYDKSEVSVRQLMTHTSGISAHIPLYKMDIQPRESIDTILQTEFAYPPESEAVYSCMGYILLGKILEITYGKPLDKLAEEMVFEPLGMQTACYCPAEKYNVAATEYAPDLNKYAKGIVHDENARFLGGVAGNAGVFASLNDMIQFANMLSNRGEGFLSSAMFEKAVANYTPNKIESRGLGFLLTGERPTFAGDLFSNGSYGHTGFTGTSLIVDNNTGLYVILLTNRVHFGRENDKIIRFRRQFHNCIMGSL